MSDARNVCEIDQDELACRIIESLFNLDRPPDATATQAIDAIEHKLQHLNARAAATSALIYMVECLKSVSSVQ